MKNFTLYGLREPGKEVRYIGITGLSVEARLKQHLYPKKSGPHKDMWITKVLREGRTLQIVPYCVGLDFEGACVLEIGVIKELRNKGFDLTNSSDGGEGGINPTKEAREKNAAAQRGEKSPNFGKFGEAHVRFGKKDTDASRLKKSLSKLGSKNSFFGRQHSSEAKEKIAASRKGTTQSPETRQKKSAASKLMWERRRQESYLAEMWR